MTLAAGPGSHARIGARPRDVATSFERIPGSRATISFGGTQSGQLRRMLIFAVPDQPNPSRPTPTP